MIELTITPMEPRENVRAYVYRLLYHNIMSVRLTPGTAVSEQEVSSYLDISRTPVREAFIHLSQDGLVEILPQRGTFISKIDTSLIEENRFMRLTLERAVIRLACQDLPDMYLKQLDRSLEDQEEAMDAGDSARFMTLDNEMHGIIFTGCGKPHVWQTLMQANLDYLRSRALSVLNKEEMGIVYAKHQSLVNHIYGSMKRTRQNGISTNISTVSSSTWQRCGRPIPIFSSDERAVC